MSHIAIEGQREGRQKRLLPTEKQQKEWCMNETGTMEGQRNFEAVTQDAEQFVKETASGLGEKAREARARLAASLASAKASLSRLNEKAVEGAKATDRVIRD